MPVTIKPSGCQVESITTRTVQTPLALLEGACKVEHQNCLELLESSFADLGPTTVPSLNGFVWSAINAYNNHHHLELRPEDVWFAILGQLSFYINRHAEELREKFVNHQDKKELVMISASKNRHSFDYRTFAEAMSKEIDGYLVDRDLKGWFMPAFSTTTEHDEVVASVLLMGSLQKYFGYTLVLRCGLPSVTLLGEKADWEKILSRLDKLKEFGYEPTQFCARLRPVISRFILSFEEPDSQEVKSFWNRIAHKLDLGSSPEYYSGWISAFCFWNLDGRIPCLERSASRSSRGRFGDPPESLYLDGVAYDAIEANKFPPGYSSVPFKIDDNGNVMDAVLVAGSVGINCTRSPFGRHKDTMSPKIGWWALVTKSDQNATERKTNAEQITEKPVPGSWMN